MRRLGYFATVTAVVCFVAPTVLAQETRATILGTVKDSSGAVVPKAEIVITNTETNTSSRLNTNEQGLYEVPLLMPGNYDVTAEAPGFKKSIRRGVNLTVGARVAIDLLLEVGATAESVIVTADAPLLETTNASVGQTFDNKAVMELPVLGNSVMLMAGLAEGMQRTGGYNYLGLHSTSGASEYSTAGGVGGNEWTLDGTPNTGHSRRAAYLPYTDAVAEFRVEATSFDASVGHGSGAQVSMLSKSGTNDFHGTATWSHWQQRWNATPSNDNAAYWKKIWDARNAGNTALADKLLKEDKQPSGRSNNWAGSIGGPVRIPKLYDGKDKLFFYFIYNGFKDAKTEEPGSKIFTMPTVAERQGDFSAKYAINPTKYGIYDPLTTKYNSKTGIYERQPFPENKIPATRILNPMYKFYEKLYPLPNNPPQMDAEGRNNYFNGNIPFNWNYKALQNRVDWVQSEQNRFFFRWSWNKFVEDRGDWTMDTARYLQSNALNRINKNAGADYVRTFNATTILNVAVSYNRYVDNGMPTERLKYKPSDVGLPTYVDQKAGDNTHLPQLDWEDNTYPDVSGGVPRMTPISVGTIKADLMKYAGKHSLKGGWDGRIYYRVGGSPGNASGRFRFRNNLMRKTSTSSGVSEIGPGWAAFLLGVPNAMDIDTNDNRYITTPYQGMFIQDSFRATSKLTLNYGGRIEYEGSIRERFNRGLRDFDPTLDVALAREMEAAYAKVALPERAAADFVIKGGVNWLGADGAPRTRTNPTWRFMPRFGFAYAMTPSLVLRGGYGTYYDTLNVSHTEIDQSGYSRGTGTTITDDNGATWRYGYFANGIAGPTPLHDPWPVREDGTRFNVPVGNSLGHNYYLGRGFDFISDKYEPAKQHRWRFEIQKQVLGNSSFSIAYTGSRTNNLGVNKSMRALPGMYWATGYVRNDAVANDLNKSVPNPFIGLHEAIKTSDPLLYQQLSTVGMFTSKTISKHQLLRPFPHMTGLTEQRQPIGKNWYNSVQLKFERRFSKGLMFNTHYEWSHTLTKDWMKNEFDAEPTWRESDESRPHRWVSTFIYELPFGKGKPIFDESRLIGAVLGGWQVGSIFQVQSGECIDFGNQIYLGDYRDLTLSGDERSKDHWFDTDSVYASNDSPSVFITNPKAQGLKSSQVGPLVKGWEQYSERALNSYHVRIFPSRMNWLRTERLVQWDANIQRTFAIQERLKAQARVDLLNAPNHQVLSGPNTDPTSSSFGRVTSYVNTPRYIQGQIRLTF